MCATKINTKNIELFTKTQISTYKQNQKRFTLYNTIERTCASANKYVASRENCFCDTPLCNYFSIGHWSSFTYCTHN